LLGLFRGRAECEARIAAQAGLNVALLPYDRELLKELAVEAGTGRPIVLTTQSSQWIAERVASHVGLFSAVVASGDLSERSTGPVRRVGPVGDRLVELYGDQGFDYIGGGRTSGGIRHAARSYRQVVAGGRSGVGYLRALIKEIRLHQWMKNTLVFVPLITSQEAGKPAAMVAACAAFLAFGLCASSVYVLNDLLDLDADRQHKTKCRRPLASGVLPIAHGLVLLAVLLAASLCLSLTLLPTEFLGALGAYYASTLAYSFWAKERVTFDVLFLAGLYTMRLLAGAAAIGVEVTFWLLAFSMFLFLSLALIKRYTEMLGAKNRGGLKAAGRGYAVDDMPTLLSMGTSAGYGAVLVLALYVNSEEVAARYAHPHFLWWLCPLLLFWISRVWIKTCRDEMHDDPIVFAASDRLSWIIGGAIVVAVWLAARA